MSKKHDENKDLRLISRIAKVSYYDKTIKAPKSSIIGNRSWGRIDFLVHYCGWMFYWDNSVNINTKLINNSDDSAIKHKRDAKKAARDNTLTNKKKRK